MSEVHSLGTFVHGVLSGFHALGLFYNLRRRNRWDVVVHAAAFGYSVRAAVHHAREAHRNRS